MILVTGATGQVGTALVEQLQAQKLPFRALAHTTASYERLTAQHVEAILADDTQPAALAAAFDDVDQLFLLTPGGPTQTATERRLVDAAREAGVRQIVKLSVLDAGDPDVSLLQPHLESEQYIKQSGIGYTFLRPNAFMQNLGNRESALIKQEGVLSNPVGDGAVSHIDTRDIAAVAIAAFSDEQHIGKTYNLTGPEALTYGEIAQKLTTLLGKPVRYVPLSDDAYQQALLSGGVPQPVAVGLTELYRSYREGKGAVVTDTVERVTGHPARSFDAYLAAHRAQFE